MSTPVFTHLLFVEMCIFIGTILQEDSLFLLGMTIGIVTIILQNKEARKK